VLSCLIAKWLCRACRAVRPAVDIDEIGGSTPALDLMDVYSVNQNTRNTITIWITPDVLSHSLIGYGVGPPVSSLALDTGKDPIQHDFVSQLGSRLEAAGQQVNYLEIGVAVLKGVHTQSGFFHNSTITSFDIEDPNPIIERLWNDKTTLDSWAASPFRKQHGRTQDYVNQYRGPNSNTLYYVAGDAFDNPSYEHMKSNIIAQHGPMNLILSDAYHTGEGVTTEVDMLISNGIIENGKDFAMVWDDCGDDIYDSFQQTIAPKLRSLFAGQATCMGQFTIPGWVGQNEFSHSTCVFTTLDLSGPSLGASQTWRPTAPDITCS